MLDKVGSVPLGPVGGRIRVVFPAPEGISPDEFLVGLSLLHIVVKSVQSIERDVGVLEEVCALGLVGKTSAINQHVAVGGTHLLVRLSRESCVLEGVCHWARGGDNKQMSVSTGGAFLCFPPIPYTRLILLRRAFT